MELTFLLHVSSLLTTDMCKKNARLHHFTERGGIKLVKPATFYSNSCIKPEEGAVMYM